MFVHILPPDVRRRIAAGEVIESPADVVKELVENSLDAEATRVEVDLSKGGKRRITVRDNGKGIHPEDLEKVFYEGATSKIHSEEDLLNIRTYGFRGEALSSISAVSRVRIRSRHFSSDEGYTIVCEGGVISERELYPMARGTEVQVVDLFFNQPARRKFLKRENAEARKVREVITDFALANPEVFFELRSNGKVLLELPPSEEEERVRRLIGEPVEVISSHLGPMSVRIYYAPSNGRGRLRCFVNSRPVNDRRLTESLKKLVGYKKNAVLFLELPPYLVDFNVHPKKREVRFLHERDVHQFIERSIYKPPPKAVSFLAQSRKEREDFKILGQIDNTVIIARIGDYIYFFDQHLLSERLNYERLGEADISCRVSLRAGERLSDEEMERLVIEWTGLSNREVCPHGRPIYHRIHLKEIYDRLGRDFHLY